jgi:hypothetical protein
MEEIQRVSQMIMDTVLNPMFRKSTGTETSTENGGVTDLRDRLIGLNVWPEAGDEFLALLPVSRWDAPPPTDEDNEWLIIVARDALHGLDIGSNYPAFFQKLITNPKLRQLFLDELDRQAISNGNGASHLV